MFVNEDYLNYKYVVAVSDNYVVLTNRSSVSADWNNPQTLPIVYQYLKPSYLTIEGDRTFNNSQIFEQIEVTSNNSYRADFTDIWTCCMLFISVVVFTVINCLTKIARRGGAINGS